MKNCCRCKRDLDTVLFSKNKGKRDGLSDTCKECQRAYTRDHYRKNKTYYIDKAAKHRRAFIEKMREFKNKPCTDCGRQFKPWQMQFDHLDPTTKVTGVANLVQRGSYEAAIQEMKKCELVCACCHADRTHQRNVQRAGLRAGSSEELEAGFESQAALMPCVLDAHQSVLTTG